MKRRRLLVAGLGAVISGCAQPGRGPGPEPVVLPVDRGSRVASSIVAGGFVPPGYAELTPPRLVVYADGTAIADAAHQLALTQPETVDLVDALRRNLSGLPPSPEPIGQNLVADAGTTTLSVLAANGKFAEVHAYALEVLDYPAPLQAAHERLESLAKRVRDKGKPYVAQRIRVVAVPQPDTSTSPRWPASVPVPGKKGDLVRVSDLTGADAQAAIMAFPVRPDGAWDTYNTRDAGNLAVAWRYLLPDE